MGTQLVAAAAAAAKSLQSCPTLCDPIDGSPPGSPVPGILQARTLEWVAISFSNAWKWKVKVKSLTHVWLLVTPWTEAYQAPLSMGFSRQEYWSGVPLPSPRIDALLCWKFPWLWSNFSSLTLCRNLGNLDTVSLNILTGKYGNSNFYLTGFARTVWDNVREIPLRRSLALSGHTVHPCFPSFHHLCGCQIRSQLLLFSC